MKKQLLLILMTLLSMVASADAVEINGIYYNLISKAKQAEVISKSIGKYTGSVVIPEKVTYESVEYSVTSIGQSAFYDCYGLTSVTIPNSVTSIGKNAFSDCSGLTSVTIGSGVTSIGQSAFANCSGLTSVTIPNSVTSIGAGAFYSCSGLTSVTIGSGVTSIGERAFVYCSGLKKVIVKDIAAWCGIKFDGSNSNPLLCAKHIYSDEDTEITNLIIPNSVTSIENYAFSDCSGLTSVTIGNSVTSIGDWAFSDCSGLKKVIVKDIAAWCGIKFNGYNSNPLGYAKHIYSDEDTEITNLIIPNSVTSISDGVFSGCSGLTSVTIPNSVTSIGSGAFRNCSGLTSVTVEKGNKVYDSRDNCNAIIETATNTLLYGSNTTIIPNSVTSIGYEAFSDCSGLTSVTIPNSVTSIGAYAFMYCSGLTSVTIGSGVTSIGQSAFANCSGLTSVTIPNSVTSIGGWAFSGCSGLTSVTIGSGVTSIGNYAFRNCSKLTSVTIGSGIKTIYSSAFASCPELTDVTCYAENVPSTNTDAFEGSYIEYATLHVPASAVNAYKAADPWKNFKSIMATDGTTPETPETPKCEKPTISYENGKLTFSSATDGAVCQYSITDTDIKAGSGNEVQLVVTYNISVYATKSGYDNSETATATLCWIDQQPKTEGITNGIANIPAQAVLIQSEGGSIKVQGVDEGTQVNVYGINGTQAGSAISQSGAAIINTNLQPGSIAIVKIGQKSVKVVVK